MCLARGFEGPPSPQASLGHASKGGGAAIRDAARCPGQTGISGIDALLLFLASDLSRELPCAPAPIMLLDLAARMPHCRPAGLSLQVPSVPAPIMLLDDASLRAFISWRADAS